MIYNKSYNFCSRSNPCRNDAGNTALNSGATSFIPHDLCANRGNGCVPLFFPAGEGYIFAARLFRSYEQMSVTLEDLSKKKANNEKIVMITSYDASFTKLVEDAGVDIILVGDSLGNTVKGEDSTIGVTVEEMIYHSRCVARASHSAMIVADMPFGSYQASLDDGVRNGIRIIKEGGAHAVKIEGGACYAELISILTRSGVPVMGHLGLTPQSIYQLSGYKVQGKSTDAAQKMMEDALALQEAGIFSLVLECVPESLAEQITQKLSVPVIGIGAGVHCDGQVLVVHDMLGINMGKKAKFVRQFANIGEQIIEAVRHYGDEVRGGTYPTDKETYH